MRLVAMVNGAVVSTLALQQRPWDQFPGIIETDGQS